MKAWTIIFLGAVVCFLLYLLYFTPRDAPQKIKDLESDNIRIAAERDTALSRELATKKQMAIQKVQDSVREVKDTKEIKRLTHSIAGVRSRVDTIVIVGTAADTLIKKLDTLVVKLNNRIEILKNEKALQAIRYEHRIDLMNRAFVAERQANTNLNSMIGLMRKEERKGKLGGTLKDIGSHALATGVGFGLGRL